MSIFVIVAASLIVAGVTWFILATQKSDVWWDSFIEEQHKAGNGPFTSMKKLPWWMR